MGVDGAEPSPTNATVEISGRVAGFIHGRDSLTRPLEVPGFCLIHLLQHNPSSRGQYTPGSQRGVPERREACGSMLGWIKLSLSIPWAIRHREVEIRVGRMIFVEPPKFTQTEMAGLIAEAVGWVQQQRDKYHPLSAPLSDSIKDKLRPFFPAEILERLRIKHVAATGETIPYPPFYERVRAGGSRVVPDAAHMTAMPFLDVALFNREPTLRTVFIQSLEVTCHHSL